MNATIECYVGSRRIEGGCKFHPRGLRGVSEDVPLTKSPHRRKQQNV
jgi:hypothetical protein